MINDYDREGCFCYNVFINHILKLYIKIEECIYKWLMIMIEKGAFATMYL